MRGGWPAAVLIVLLVFLSGCAEIVDQPSDPDVEKDGGLDPEEDEIKNSSSQDGSSPRAIETEDDHLEKPVSNPWNNKTISVGVAENASPSIQNGTMHAVEFWNGNASRYATYKFEFIYTSEPSGADIVIQPDDHPLVCGYTVSTATIGCAPILNASATVGEQTEVQVVRDIPEPAARSAIKHELGHVLGLKHDDEPNGLMSHESRLTERQQSVVESVDSNDVEHQIEQQINTERKRLNQDSLSGDDGLRNIARERAAELAARNESDSTGIGLIEPDLELECEIDLGGLLYLPEGDANVYATSLYAFQSATGYVDYSNASYIGSPTDAVDETVSRWHPEDDIDRTEHYERQGVGVHISNDGDFTAVRAIC